MRKKRIDVLLFERGIFSSREKAKVAVMAGDVYVNGKKVLKPSQLVDTDCNIDLKEKPLYVSRGGIKCEKAIKYFNINLKDKVAVDIGASTGGFVDCMLRFGAKKVYAIDVGYGQLSDKLRNDERVVNIEKTNARYITKDLFQEQIDIVTMDVSFISVKKILPVVKSIISDDGKIILLVKPQFEAERKYVKKGIVKDKNVHISVIQDIIDFCKGIDLYVLDITFSPLTGDKGNIEYFLFIGKQKRKNTGINVQKIVDEAHSLLV